MQAFRLDRAWRFCDTFAPLWLQAQLSFGGRQAWLSGNARGQCATAACSPDRFDVGDCIYRAQVADASYEESVVRAACCCAMGSAYGSSRGPSGTGVRSRRPDRRHAKWRTVVASQTNAGRKCQFAGRQRAGLGRRKAAAARGHWRQPARAANENRKNRINALVAVPQQTGRSDRFGFLVAGQHDPLAPRARERVERRRPPPIFPCTIAPQALIFDLAHAAARGRSAAVPRCAVCSYCAAQLQAVGQLQSR